MEAAKIVEHHARERRKQWAARLVKARARLESLKSAIASASQELAHSILLKQPPNELGYPEIPDAGLDPHKEGAGLPPVSGIYFLWENDVIVYVGQSVRLCDRVKLGGHHVLKPHHRISYLPMASRDLTWAECYYIGITKAVENFGNHASHRRAV
jgi:hypothetical protein